MRAGPARVKDAGPTSGAIGATHKAKEALRVPPCAKAHLAGGRMSASRVKREEKIARSVLACPGSIGSVSRRFFLQEKEQVCVPSELLRVVEAFGGCAYSGDFAAT